MRANRPYIPLYGPLHFLYGEQTHICILHSLCGIKRKTYKGDHNLLGEKKGKEKKKNTSLSGTHHGLSSRTSRKHTIIFCQFFPYAIPSRAPKIFFSLFASGCALIPTSNNGPSSAFKKGRFVLGVIACVMRVAVTFQTR